MSWKRQPRFRNRRLTLISAAMTPPAYPLSGGGRALSRAAGLRHGIREERKDAND